MRRLFVSSLRQSPNGPRATVVDHGAFTLIELLVVVVILTVLASLSLAGLAGARQRSKIDKTRSTIRKIDAVIRPMYDSYRTRRVITLNDDGTNAGSPLIAASNRLRNIRRLMMYEMPDAWADVATSGTQAPPGLPTPLPPALLSLCHNGATRAYGFVRARNPDAANGSAECVYMILTRSGFDPESLETFRNDEVTDVDNDGAKEFSDGWGTPIRFFRWAPGFSSPYSLIQFANPSQYHDPLDPLARDPNAFSLAPLIVSSGPDEATNDLLTINEATGWNAVPARLLDICRTQDAGSNGLIGAPNPADPTAYRDNITNHDLSRK